MQLSTEADAIVIAFWSELLRWCMSHERMNQPDRHHATHTQWLIKRSMTNVTRDEVLM